MCVWYIIYEMRKPIGTLLASSLVVVTPLDADTITCKNGRVIHGEVTHETEQEVTIGLYGAQVIIPRAQISSIARATAEDNRLLEKKYEQLDEHYKEESSEAAKRNVESGQAESIPAPTPADPPPDDGDDPDEPEVVIFPAYPPGESPPAQEEPAAPTPTNKVEERLSWEQKVRQAIYHKRVIPGMTEKQVQSAWGFPNLVHPVHGIYNYTDRWTYDRDGVGKVNVYFNNGIVVSVYQ
jgi:hypothetical protein